MCNTGQLHKQTNIIVKRDRIDPPTEFTDVLDVSPHIFLIISVVSNLSVVNNSIRLTKNNLINTAAIACGCEIKVLWWLKCCSLWIIFREKWHKNSLIGRARPVLHVVINKNATTLFFRESLELVNSSTGGNWTASICYLKSFVSPKKTRHLHFRSTFCIWGDILVNRESLHWLTFSAAHKCFRFSPPSVLLF